MNNGGGKEAAAARAEEQQRQARIREGTERINNIFDNQFTDDYYGTTRQSYLDYANPQLEDQYAKAQKELTFALTRAGLTDSSVRGQKVAELQKEYDLNKQKVADEALSYGTKMRTNVEDARGNLVSMLNATGDAEAAANQAVNRAQVLSEPAAFSPLSQLFTNFTQGLGTQAALERANYYTGGAVKPTYNTGLFSPRQSMEVK